MQSSKIGLLGAGNLAEALIRGLLASGTVSRDQLRASDIRAERLAQLERDYQITVHTDNETLVRWANVVVLAVKPQVVARVLDEVAGALGWETLLISVAAGVPVRALQARLSADSRIVRVMPNTPALVLAGATAVAPGAHATEDDVATTMALFQAVGRSAVVDESVMDVATGLSGSGPAYVMLVLEALADGAVRLGMPRETAVLLAAQTLFGAAKLQLETGRHPAELRDMVTSPGGTTAAGLHALEAGGLRATLIRAVEEATRRAAELGAALAPKR
jgi:pyrroline-5-carboxylate reductase